MYLHSLLLLLLNIPNLSIAAMWYVKLNLICFVFFSFLCLSSYVFVNTPSMLYVFVFMFAFVAFDFAEDVTKFGTYLNTICKYFVKVS